MILASIALFGVFSFLQPALRPLQTHEYGLAGWHLTTEHNTFTHQLDCKVWKRPAFSPPLSIKHSALLISFPKTADTFRAWYSLDDGAAQRASDDHAQLLSAGALAHSELLDNGTGGVLAIPLAKLNGVRFARVQLRNGDRPKVFDLRSLAQVLAAARGVGCTFDKP